MKTIELQQNLKNNKLFFDKEFLWLVHASQMASFEVKILQVILTQRFDIFWDGTSLSLLFFY